MIRVLFLALPWMAAFAFAAGSLEEALKLYDAGRFPQAAQALKPLADQGNPVAQRKMGLLHYFGNGVKEDERKAVEYLRKAAAQGDADAMYHLAVAYTFGNDAARMTDDPDGEAARWYFEAAQAGHRDAQYSLGLMFLSGKGVVQSQEEAAKWITMAAKQGHPEAQNFIRGISPTKR